jgi:small subunit ribosomal protein S1
VTRAPGYLDAFTFKAPSMTENASPESPRPSNSSPASARSDLDAMLEAEVSAALGGMSVEDLVGEKPRSRAAPAPANKGRQLRTGKVLRVHGGDVFVEFGPRSQGVCPAIQFEAPPQPGDELEFVVDRLDAFEGLLLLSRPGVVQKADWGNLAEGMTVEARCIGMNKGGLEMEVAHHKGFMPAGMVDVRHLADISVFIGEKFPCRIVELNREKGRIILSRKAVLAAERREKAEQLLAVLEEGQTRSATILSLQPYGAFADLGGIDGLIHISDLSHDRIRHAKDAVKEGEVVQVKVLRIDRSVSPPKISLGRKQTMSDPIASALNTVAAGETVTGKVTKTTEFGAFVEIAPGVEGLVHISEVSHDRIPTVDTVLKRDEVVTCKVLAVDPGRKRISLSIKALVDPPVRAAPAERAGPGGNRGRGDRRDGPKPEAPREDDPELRKLKARFGGGSQLRGGLG